VGGCNSEEEPPTPNRHHHNLHLNQKNYEDSKTGGNRPISIPVAPRASVTSLSDPSAPQERHTHRSSRHKSRSVTAGAPVRKHRSRSDAADAPVRKHSSRSKKHRPEIEPESAAELASPKEPPPAPAPIPAPTADMPNQMSTSLPSGSSMGIVISSHQKRRDTDGSSKFLYIRSVLECLC
jgi:hypothetical protein